MGSAANSYLTNCLLIYICSFAHILRKPFHIYVSICTRSYLNVLIHEENFLFFFISVRWDMDVLKVINHLSWCCFLSSSVWCCSWSDSLIAVAELNLWLLLQSWFSDCCCRADSLIAVAELILWLLLQIWFFVCCCKADSLIAVAELMEPRFLRALDKVSATIDRNEVSQPTS